MKNKSQHENPTRNHAEARLLGAKSTGHGKCQTKATDRDQPNLGDRPEKKWRSGQRGRNESKWEMGLKRRRSWIELEKK